MWALNQAISIHQNECEFISSRSSIESLIPLLGSNYSHRLKYLVELELQPACTIERPPRSKLAGTKAFMAIGALRGEPHSFMHGLESFFCVLFWVCIHHDSFNENGKVERRIVPNYEQ